MVCLFLEEVFFGSAVIILFLSLIQVSARRNKQKNRQTDINRTKREISVFRLGRLTSAESEVDIHQQSHHMDREQEDITRSHSGAVSGEGGAVYRGVRRRGLGAVPQGAVAL